MSDAPEFRIKRVAPLDLDGGDTASAAGRGYVPLAIPQPNTFLEIERLTVSADAGSNTTWRIFEQPAGQSVAGAKGLQYLRDSFISPAGTFDFLHPIRIKSPNLLSVDALGLVVGPGGENIFVHVQGWVFEWVIIEPKTVGSRDPETGALPPPLYAAELRSAPHGRQTKVY